VGCDQISVKVGHINPIEDPEGTGFPWFGVNVTELVEGHGN
jgi:hypothetical protein